MATLDKKSRILENAGYTYSFEREVYFNQKDRKVFSLEFVEDHSEAELQRYLKERDVGTGWRFYFNSPPSESVKHEIQSVLE